MLYILNIYLYNYIRKDLSQISFEYYSKIFIVRIYCSAIQQPKNSSFQNKTYDLLYLTLFQSYIVRCFSSLQLFNLQLLLKKKFFSSIKNYYFFINLLE